MAAGGRSPTAELMYQAEVNRFEPISMRKPRRELFMTGLLISQVLRTWIGMNSG